MRSRARIAPLQSVIVVDDCSTDGTVGVAESSAPGSCATGSGGTRADRATGAGRKPTGDVVVFLDSDAVPEPGWSAGLHQALDEYPGAIVGCARTFTSRTPWGWVAHLQIETPHLPRGEPRGGSVLSSYCMAVPREAPLRWDESYGGEDGLFSVDARDAGFELVFDPRFHAVHIHERETFSDLRKQQRRMAYGFARCRDIRTDGLHKRMRRGCRSTTSRWSGSRSSTGG